MENSNSLTMSQSGRPAKFFNFGEFKRINNLRKKGYGAPTIAKKLKCSSSTIYKILVSIEEQNLIDAYVQRKHESFKYAVIEPMIPEQLKYKAQRQLR